MLLYIFEGNVSHNLCSQPKLTPSYRFFQKDQAFVNILIVKSQRAIVLRKFTVSQVPKKIPTFCRAQNLMTVSSQQPTKRIQSQINPNHTLISYYVKNKCNIYLPQRLLFPHFLLPSHFVPQLTIINTPKFITRFGRLAIFITGIGVHRLQTRQETFSDVAD